MGERAIGKGLFLQRGFLSIYMFLSPLAFWVEGRMLTFPKKTIRMDSSVAGAPWDHRRRSGIYSTPCAAVHLCIPGAVSGDPQNSPPLRGAPTGGMGRDLGARGPGGETPHEGRVVDPQGGVRPRDHRDEAPVVGLRDWRCGGRARKKAGGKGGDPDNVWDGPRGAAVGFR